MNFRDSLSAALGLSPIRYRAPLTLDEAKRTDQAGAQWRTVGGARALVDLDSGQILAGCPGLEGEDLDEIGEHEDPASRERRKRKQEKAEAQGWEGSEQKDARAVWNDALEEAPEAHVVLVKIGDTYYTFDDHARHLIKHGVAGSEEGEKAAADFKEGHRGAAINKLIGAGLRVAIAEPAERDLSEMGGDRGERPEEAEIAQVKQPKETAQQVKEPPKTFTTDSPAAITIKGHELEAAQQHGQWFWRKKGGPPGWIHAGEQMAAAIEQQLNPQRAPIEPAKEPEKPAGTRADRREEKRQELLGRYRELTEMGTDKALRKANTLASQIHKLGGFGEQPEEKERAPRQSAQQILAERIREYVGDDPQDQVGFRELVEDVWQEKRRQVIEENDALRNLVGGNQGRLIRQVQRAEDPDQIPHFDELVDYAVAHYPQLLRFDRGSIDAENALFNRLKTGLRPMPARHSDEVLQEAWEIVQHSQKPSSLGPEWDHVEFSQRKSNWWQVTRYRAALARAAARRQLPRRQRRSIQRC